MNNKMRKVLKDNKKYIILFLVLWTVLEIVLIAPIAVAISQSITIDGKFDLGTFFTSIGKEVSSFSAITRVFSSNSIGAFGKGTLWFTILFLVLATIGFLKSKPKHSRTKNK